MEGAAIRLATITDYFDMIDATSPAIDILKNIQSDVATAIPEANQAFMNISNLSSDICFATQISVPQKVSLPLDEDAIAILGEVEDRFEEDAKSKLPDPSILTLFEGKRQNPCIPEEFCKT